MGGERVVDHVRTLHLEHRVGHGAKVQDLVEGNEEGRGVMRGREEDREEGWLFVHHYNDCSYIITTTARTSLQRLFVHHYNDCS